MPAVTKQSGGQAESQLQHITIMAATHQHRPAGSIDAMACLSANSTTHFTTGKQLMHP
jgi:hypothetical protein